MTGIRPGMNHMASPILGVRSGGRASIIKQIQYGSISIGAAASSNTATITAVTTANCLIFWNGAYNGTASTNQNMIADVVLTNTTTVTATRSSTSDTCVARFVVVEFVPGVLTSVQRGTITIASGSTSNTATITSVSENVAFFNCLGFRNNNSSNERIDSAFATVDLTDATTVTAARTTNDTFDTIVGYQVAEFNSLYIYRTAKVQAVLSAASGFLTLTGAVGSAISTYPQGGVPFIGFAGFKVPVALASAFFTPSLEFSTNNTYKMFFTRDLNGSSTSGTTSLSVVFFRPDFIKAAQLITVPMLAASSATDLLPANNVAAKTLVALTGYRTDSAVGQSSAGCLGQLSAGVYYDGANLLTNRGSGTNNLYLQTSMIEFV